jgi:two-component sensor histidine kinase
VPGTFHLRLSPRLDAITAVRRFVSEFYAPVLNDDDLTSRMALATHELLENAVKYAASGEAELDIAVEPGAEGDCVVIRTSNRATPERLRVAIDAFAEMSRNEDPFVYYQQVMRRSARRQEGSGLGLARIRAEAEMALSCDVADERLTITARCVAGVRP